MHALQLLKTPNESVCSSGYKCSCVRFVSEHTDAATIQIVQRILHGQIVPLFCREILDEYALVLNRRRFNFSKDLTDSLLAAIESYGIMVFPSSTGEILPDIKDLPFYEVAMENQYNKAYLVTGNIKHFPQKDFIITPRKMIDMLDAR